MSRWHTRTKELTLQFVRWPSVTGTAGETTFAHKLHALLAQHTYFQANPNYLWLQRTTDDAHERYNIIAMVRGTGSRAVALAGHFDTVPVNDYGTLAPLATEPDALLSKLIADLRGRTDTVSQQALADLDSGDYLPGRASLDMKSGVAVGMAVLERFAALPEHARVGTLILIATPDEEGSSAGMRSAVAELPTWLAQHSLSLEAVINLDATNDTGNGSDGRSIYLGSTGKLLSSVMFVGQVAHTGNPFAGVGAAFLAAQFVQAMDYNPAYGDALNSVPAPPPITLQLRDGKQTYDVTSPMTAWCAVNLLSHQRSATQAFADVQRAVHHAMEDALVTMSERASHSRVPDQHHQQPAWHARIYTYAELRAHVLAHLGSGDIGLRRLDELESATSREGDPFHWLRRDQQAVEALWEMGGLQGPAAVVCTAAPFYPLVRLDEDSTKGARLMQAIHRHAAALTQDTGLSFQLRPIFLGTSDMSFFAQPTNDDDRRILLDNAPTHATKTHIAGHIASMLDTPVVNIGPWGRDYHQRTERLYMPYAFDTLPELVWRVAVDVVSDRNPSQPDPPTPEKTKRDGG